VLSVYSSTELYPQLQLFLIFKKTISDSQSKIFLWGVYNNKVIRI
jgi:hypothetical protein